MTTHIFTLPTGIECEIRELDTSHQELLTGNDKSKTHIVKLEEVIHDITVRVGSVINPTKEFIENMLACDKKKILVEARNFSMDFEDFVFVYEYKDKDGNKKEQTFNFPISEESFPTVSVKKLVGSDWVDANYKEYTEVEKTVNTTLPRSGTDVQFTMLDGKGERIAATYTKKTITSSTPIVIRRPVRFELSKDQKKIPIQISVSKLPLRDTEHLRSLIRKVEGDVDTTITFDRPEDDVTGDTSVIQMDIIQTTAFFFPSGAI